jgi:hypothetical protein
VVAFVQRRFAGIEPVEVAHQTLHHAMCRVVEQIPARWYEGWLMGPCHRSTLGPLGALTGEITE